MAIKLNTPPIDSKEIREKLPKGFAIDLQKVTGYSNKYIYQVIEGERNNIIVWEAARDLVNSKADLLESLKEKFSRPTKQDSL